MKRALVRFCQTDSRPVRLSKLAQTWPFRLSASLKCVADDTISHFMSIMNFALLPHLPASKKSHQTSIQYAMEKQWESYDKTIKNQISIIFTEAQLLERVIWLTEQPVFPFDNYWRLWIWPEKVQVTAYCQCPIDMQRRLRQVLLGADQFSLSCLRFFYNK